MFFLKHCPINVNVLHKLPHLRIFLVPQKLAIRHMYHGIKQALFLCFYLPLRNGNLQKVTKLTKSRTFLALIFAVRVPVDLACLHTLGSFSKLLV